jgi:hypothetical protein
MDFDDDDVHPCGCDRACVCSDRFSWFAVPPTPVHCDGTFAADSLRVHQIPSRGCTPLEIFHLNFRSLFQSNVTSSINRTASANLFVARAKCVRAEPMKRHDLRTI